VLPDHFRLLDGQDRTRGHRRRHPLRLARKTALAEEMACIEQGDHGLFPACDKTDSRTTPSSRYMTLVAGEPCAKIIAAGPYSARCVRAPVQSRTPAGVSVGARFDLAIAHSPSVARAPQCHGSSPPSRGQWFVQVDTNILCSQITQRSGGRVQPRPRTASVLLT
jgi:hypothetical protein